MYRNNDIAVATTTSTITARGRYSKNFTPQMRNSGKATYHAYRWRDVHERISTLHFALPIIIDH